MADNNDIKGLPKGRPAGDIERKHTMDAQESGPGAVAAKAKGAGGQQPSKPFHVVGMGASAGGFEALEQFFDNMPSDSGMAFVIVQHLSPDYKSLMVELLSKHTSMRVVQVENGAQLEPNNVYLLPPKKNMTVFGGRLHLADKATEPTLNFPIDIFLNSLADDMGERAIGIILSGTGSDGTRGIREVKEQGGMVMVQEPGSAKFDGMPRNAISTGLVDYVVTPQQMPEELLKFLQHPYMAKEEGDNKLKTDDNKLIRIFSILKNKTGLDFTYYKQNTVLRRIERRMSVNQIAKVDDYVNYLYQNPAEVQTLYKELLIGVTRFFRDPETYELLKTRVVPELVKAKMDRSPIRVWVAGCSTGEEAYSMAILFREYLDKIGAKNEVKIFATDVDHGALEYASAGQYPENIAADMSSSRFQHHFVRKGDKYQVAKHIREMVIFALHNLIKDPPFNKIDLLSCRNLLIYLQPVLQQKVLLNFNFALNENGFLFLGSSETIGNFTNLFTPFDSKWKLYRCKGKQAPLYVDNFSITPVHQRKRDEEREFEAVGKAKTKDEGIRQDAQSVLFNNYVPPSIVINPGNHELLHVFGEVSPYLALRPGEVSLNVSNLIRKDLSIALETGIHKATREDKESLYRDVRIKDEEKGEVRKINLRVIPFKEAESSQGMVLVIFEEGGAATGEEASEAFNLDSQADQRIQDLESELQYTKENLQATIEELETTNEELQATNEELLSANEELQSTNEELQSVNEELITVNSEYQSKIQELTELNNDMNNLLSSTNIGTIFLDKELRLRKFTPAIRKEANLLDSDIGRPIRDISFNLDYAGIVDDARSVMETLSPLDREVRNQDGKWLLMRILPYRTEQNLIRGVVITFLDVTRLKAATAEIAKLSRALELSPSITVISDQQGVIEYVNEAFTQVTGIAREQAEGKSLRFLESGESQAADVKAMWKAVKEAGKWSGQLVSKRRDGSLYHERVRVLPLRDNDGVIRHILRVSEDITEQMKTEALAKKSQDRALAILENTTDSYVELDDKLRFTFVNRKAGRLLKRKKAELVGKKFWSVTDLTRDGALGRAVNRALETGKSVTDEEYVEPLDKWLEYHVFFLDGVACVYFRDISRSHEQVEALRKEHEQMLGVASTSPVAITVVEAESMRITFANKQAERLYGLSQKELTSRSVDDAKWDLRTLDGEPLAVEALPSRQVLATGKPVFGVAFSIKTSRGKRLYLSVNSAPLFDKEGEIRAMVNAVEDLTELERMREDLRRLKQQD